MPLLLVAIVVGLVLLMPRKALGYVGGQPVELDLRSIGDGHQLRADAASAFNLMRAAARAAGVDLIVNESFRTMEQQQSFWSKFQAGGSLAAKPGYSNHQGGIALDIDLNDDAGKPRPAASWLPANASRFGFRRTVKSEPWHWEYKP